jgi:hypothetical protein
MFETAGVIKEDEYKNWQKLRNTTAHGGLHIPRGELQKLLNSVYKATTSLNKLVFQAIGHRGRYIDYSISGWPEATFNPSDSAAGSTEQINIPCKFHHLLSLKLRKLRLLLIRCLE